MPAALATHLWTKKRKSQLNLEGEVALIKFVDALGCIERETSLAALQRARYGRECAPYGLGFRRKDGTLKRQAISHHRRVL